MSSNLTASATPCPAPLLFERQAQLSPCGEYRYRLLRRWQAGPTLLFVMLNPSWADGAKDDPTTRRCIGFAQAHGFGAIELVNLYAWRSPHPQALKAASYPVGPDNDRHIRAALKQAGAVCVAWGNAARPADRPRQLLRMIERAGHRAQCLAITRQGQPAHPLMLPKRCRLQSFDRPAEA